MKPTVYKTHNLLFFSLFGDSFETLHVNWKRIESGADTRNS